MVPVCQKYRAKIFIVVGRGWPVDDQRAEKTVAVLESEVRVVPGGSILAGVEFVRESLSGSNGALRDPGYSIELRAVQLPNSMPVDRLSSLSISTALGIMGITNRAILCQVVGDMND
jgi:hypothetical protein